MHNKLKTLLLLAPAALIGAAPAAPLSPGLWEVLNTPGTATLDGRRLTDLPLSKLEPERLCLSAAQAQDPASFLLGNVRAECRIVESSLSGGKLRVRGQCPGEDGYEDATLLLGGRYKADRYKVTFRTSSHGSNGRMTFSGKLLGRRVGDCGPA